MKKIFSSIIFLGLLFAAESATAQWWTLGLGEPEPPAKTVLPRPVEQAEVDWFSDVAGTSGFTSWIEEVRDGAASALVDTAAVLREAVGTVDDAVSQVVTVVDSIAQSTPVVNFDGKNVARAFGEAAQELADAAQLNAALARCSGDTASARRDNEYLRYRKYRRTEAAEYYVALVTEGAQSGLDASAEVQNLKQEVTVLKRTVADLRAAMVAADTTLRAEHAARLEPIEATLAAAFTPAVPDSAGIAAVPEEFREGVLALRRASTKHLKKAAKELAKLQAATVVDP